MGFALALEEVEILGLDIDKDAVFTYNLNLTKYGCKARRQDILAWRPAGEFDIVIGGPPCQPFSHANVTNIGETHPLYPTFPQFFDVILALKPKAFLMENVRGLLRKRFEQILQKQLGRVAGEYNVWYAVLNAADYGVPQRRERLFVVGIRRDVGAGFRFPEPTHGEKPLVRLDGVVVHRWVTLREAIGDLAPLPPEEMAQLVVPPEAAERIRREREDEGKYWTKMEFPDDPGKPARTIAANTVEGVKKSTIIVPALPVAKGDEVYQGSFSPIYLSRNRRADWDEPGYAVLATARHEPLHPSSAGIVYRRLSVRECLRVQSFPDWWMFPASVSTTKKYRLVGEAVSPILAYRLAVALGRALGLPTREPPKEEEWQLPYFQRAFADYLGGSP